MITEQKLNALKEMVSLFPAGTHQCFVDAERREGYIFDKELIVDLIQTIEDMVEMLKLDGWTWDKYG